MRGLKLPENLRGSTLRESFQRFMPHFTGVPPTTQRLTTCIRPPLYLPGPHVEVVSKNTATMMEVIECQKSGKNIRVA